jgi:hypothetical protein
MVKETLRPSFFRLRSSQAPQPVRAPAVQRRRGVPQLVQFHRVQQLARVRQVMVAFPLPLHRALELPALGCAPVDFHRPA